MTAPAEVPRPADHAPIVVDLDAPGVYAGMVRLARLIEQHIRAMPLEAMVDEAKDAADRDLLLGYPMSTRTVRRDREIIEALASAQRELVKIRARAGG